VAKVRASKPSGNTEAIVGLHRRHQASRTAMTWQGVPLIIACVGWIGVLGSVVVAARYEVGELGSGLVLNWLLATGMLASGLLLVS
jgi:hypothetical protein